MQLDSARSDKAASVIFAGLGIAMGVGGFTMDRLEIRHIHPASIPGLVPMFLGVLLLILAVMMFLKARAQTDGTATWKREEATSDEDWSGEMTFTATHRLLLTAGLCIVFAFGLVGRMPFFAASALFIFSFATIFTWPAAGPRFAKIRSLLIAATVAIVAAAAISSLFRYGFLVRLP